MTAINKALQAVTLGDVQRFENLHITPLLAPASGTADYLTLAEAQEQGLAVVTEVSESGSVPTLLLENNADQALFLLDGRGAGGCEAESHSQPDPAGAGENVTEYTGVLC